MIPLFPNDALLLIAHGSARYPNAGRAVRAHADTLRALGHFNEVGVGFLNGAPAAAEALAALGSRTIHVVPFFMEDGYFVRVAVPRALAGQPAGSLRFCPPVGTHEAMAKLMEARALRGCPDPQRVTLVLVGHGSARSPGRPMALHRHAEQVRGFGRFAAVHVAFLEEPPLVADVLAATRGSAVAVVGVFAGEGMHASDDLPALIDAERSRRERPVLDLGSVTEDAGMLALILDQVARGG